MSRIGIFICHCGTNIGSVLDISHLLTCAKKFPLVTCTEQHKYLCSELGQNLLRTTIETQKLDKIVIAACSPRMHENTFRKTLSKAGLNPYVLEIANLREHCSWVHEKSDDTNQKALDLIQMAVNKVTSHEPLYSRQIQICKKALVIGGGIAGIQTALDIADAGHSVVIVEKQSSIGGHMAQLDKTFPTLDCSACILTPKMMDVAQHPNIQFLTYAEVISVTGSVGNFQVQIRKKAKKVDHSKCNGCGLCSQKCPEKISSEFDLGLGERKAIYIPFPQAVPNKPIIDIEHCRYQNFQRWVQQQGQGKKPPECRICEKICPTQAIDWNQEEVIETDNFGVIIAATGYDLFDASTYEEYGAGKYPDVISSLHLERLMCASGPTGGHVIRPSDHTVPKTIVFIQCVGSRDDLVNRPYCSKICCMYTAKHILMLKEHDPEVECYVFYIDIRAGGKNFEEFSRRAQEKPGTIYLRGRVSQIYPYNKKLVVQGVDSLADMPVEIMADLVVLATGVEACSDAEKLAQTLHISYDTYHFLMEAHPKLKPVETQTDGILLAGAAVGPRDIPDSVAQGSAAAAKAIGLLSKPYLLTDPLIAFVNVSSCMGCQVCKNICPYQAIEMQTGRDGNLKAMILESICKGCGLCVSTCRSGAINLRGSESQQLLSEVITLAS